MNEINRVYYIDDGVRIRDASGLDDAIEAKLAGHDVTSDSGAKPSLDFLLAKKREIIADFDMTGSGDAKDAEQELPKTPRPRG